MPRKTRKDREERLSSVYGAFEHVHRLALALREPALLSATGRAAALADVALLERTCRAGRRKTHARELSEEDAVCVRIVGTCDAALLRSSCGQASTGDTTERFFAYSKVALRTGPGKATLGASYQRLADEARAICDAFLNVEIEAADELLEHPDILVAGYVNR